METKEIEDGKKWVERTIKNIATEYDVPIDSLELEWGQSAKDFDQDILSLKYFMGGKRYVEKFSEDNLEDCAKSQNIRTELETRLRKSIKSKITQSKKKIGFLPEVIILLTAWFIFYSCASTRITAMKDPPIPSRSYQTILVIAPFADLESRKIAEDMFVTKLSPSGVWGLPSLSILFPGRKYSNDEFSKLILDSGADGILLVTLTDAYTEQTYVPPSSYSTGTATLQGNVARYSATTQHYGGYYISKPRVRYDIRLFDVSTGQTAWMATSLTRGNAFARFPKLVESLADTAVEQMRKDRLIP